MIILVIIMKKCLCLFVNCLFNLKVIMENWVMGFILYKKFLNW